MGGKKISKKSGGLLISGTRRFLLFLIPFIVFSIGFIPCILSLKIILIFLDLSKFFHWLLFPLIIVLELFILLISQILISGVIIRIFRIRYGEGLFEYSFGNKTAFRWMLVCQLYTPIRKILEIIPMGGFQRLYLKLLGLKLGKNSLVGGVIKDPCVTEIGDNVTIGEYAVIYAHIHNYEKGTLMIKKVKIGNNCVIGAGAIIMPGVIMEDGSVAGAGAIVPKNSVLEKNKIYVGNPSRPINTEKKER